ncbi:MAG: gluconokinase [Sphingobacteriaceae bacterium]
MKSNYILGIDIGTGSTKAVAVNHKNEVIATAQVYYATHNPEMGYSEQEPALIWNAFTKCISEVLQELRKQPAAISLSSAMHSLIPVNDQGMELGQMLTWADARSEEIATRLREAAYAEQLYQTSGTPLYGMSPLCKIIWFRENQPALYEKTDKFIGIKEYIWFRLFQAFEVDFSIASATGLFDITHLEWNNFALELSGITSDRLSVPVNTDYVRRDLHAATAQAMGLKANTPFVIGASDGCLANLGSLATQDGIAALSIGTSGAVRVASEKPVFNFGAMTFNYLLDARTFICGGAVNNGGMIVDWLLKDFMHITTTSSEGYETLFKLISTKPAGSNGLLFLPYLSGERTPIWDARSCGVFFGIKLQHEQAHFLRAAAEGICMALHHVLQSVEDTAGKITQINVSGGFVSSAEWLRILADITGKRLVIHQTNDSSAIGAAYLARKAIGLIADYQEIVKPNKVEEIAPNLENHDTYQRYFELFKKLYVDLQDSMNQLHCLKANQLF